MNVGLIGHYWTSNFGDVLLRDLMEKHLKNNSFVSDVYTINAKNFGIHVSIFGKLKFLISLVFKSDIIIFGGGGYLESTGAGYSNKFILSSFYMVCLVCRILNKPYYIFGPGVGPKVEGFSGKLIKKICSGAKRVIVRDNESKDLLLSLEVKREIEVLVDGALILLNESTINVNVNNKIAIHLMLHPNEIEAHASKLIKFINSIPAKYDLTFISDNGPFVHDSEIIDNISRDCHLLTCNDNEIFKNFISTCEYLITTKLHVGIVGFSLGAKVFNAYRHPKCLRFYKQINAINNSYALKELTSENLKNIQKSINCNDHFEKYSVSKYEMKNKVEKLYLAVDEEIDKINV
jgi:polysaccharide pyruvyl transferase WcaK-like protein